MRDFALEFSMVQMDNVLNGGYGRIEAGMRRPILTPKRKDKLADYCLNISVASFAVAAFEDKWWGLIPAFIFIAVFFILTED